MTRRRFLHIFLTLALVLTSISRPLPASARLAPAQPVETPPQEAKAANGNEGGDLSARLAAIEKTVEAERIAKGIPGLALVIVKDDQVIYAKGFGMRDVERKLPVTPDTLFAIGSCTKAFTA
ncbi:MAG TPA: serine hydrolase domain-containing protein, partial [Pyrinomonadaceae bacterium]